MTPFESTVAEPFGAVDGGVLMSWKELATRDDARAVALEMGRLHGEWVAELAALGEANGGGPLGLGRGILGLRVQQGLISATDHDRLMAILEYVVNSATDTDPAAVVARVEALHQEIVDDPESSLPALAASAIAVDSITQAASPATTFSDTFASGATTMLADIGGMFVGFAGGISGGVAVGYTASAITQALT
jgi:hypothetical protein